MNVGWKFILGFAMTLAMVIFVPYLNTEYVTPYIVEKLSSLGPLLQLPVETIVQIAMYLGLFLFMIILGGGAVFRYCGVAGVIGLIAAYAVLGDIMDALIPVASLITVTIITWSLSRRREAKKKAKEEEKIRLKEEKKAEKKRLGKERRAQKKMRIRFNPS